MFGNLPMRALDQIDEALISDAQTSCKDFKIPVLSETDD